MEKPLFEYDWRQYVTLRSEESVALAGQILRLTEKCCLRPEETQALLIELCAGEAELNQLTVSMESQGVHASWISLIADLHLTWLQMTDVVERYAQLVAATWQGRGLRLVSSQ